jgi:Xaa-Pro aminopeptidase
MKNEFEKRLSATKTILKDQKIDFFILPNSDEFFSEYLPENEKRIEYLTGFNGSNATLIIGEKISKFFTDGRYILQSKNQIDSKEFEIFNISQTSVLNWLESNLTAKHRLAIDPKLSSINFVKTVEKIIVKAAAELVFLEKNPVDQIWQERPKARNSEVFFIPNDEVWSERPKAKNSEIFFIPKKFSGAEFAEKRKQVLENLEAEALLITKPENLCWLLNLRASDIEFSPLLLSYGILFKSGEVDLFVDEKRFLQVPKDINLVQSNCFDLRIAVLKKNLKKIQIDPASTNYWFYQLLQKNGFEVILKKDEIEILKACKNEAEISGIIKAHEADGLAVTKFLFWLTLRQAQGKDAIFDEISAAEKLLEFRKKHSDFLYPSFASISGFASNGAVIHYHADTKTNKKIRGNSLYLIDSGGQYFGENCFGTTDITRTIAIGKPSREMIENFTRVLKGNIALSCVKFPKGTSGAQLDALARSPLWEVGLDFDHGTGHGVGSFLSVHEGPQNISRRGFEPLREGMILSNEPGFYKAGEYGIRIENLMLVEKFDEKFLQFKTITLAPIDVALIDFEMLTKTEKNWLKKYHEEILEKLKDGLDEKEKSWLGEIIKKFSV